MHPGPGDPIVTFTPNPALDLHTEVEHVIADRKLRCLEPSMEPGGGGINVARVVRILGGDPLAVWTSGAPIGPILAQALERSGVRHHAVGIGGATRQNMTVLESSSGRQFRFGMPGPTLRPDEVEECLRALGAACGGCGFLVMSGSLPPGVEADLYAQVIRAAGSGVRVVCDTSGAALRAALDAGVYLIKPNLAELTHLVGRRLKDDDEVVDAAAEIVAADEAEAVLVSLGAGGAVLVQEDQVVRIRSPMVPVESRIGAGDSMVGGAVWALSGQRSLEEAALWAVAAGAAAVMTPGSALCRRDDVSRLFDQLVKGGGDKGSKRVVGLPRRSRGDP